MPSRHPELRARSARHFVILSGGREAPGVEGPHRTRRPAAAWKRPGRDARGSSNRPRRRSCPYVILSGGREAPGVEGPHRTRRPAAAWKRLGWDDCHPERRARSARSRRTSPDAKACSGVEAPWPGRARVFRPAAPARRESASDPRKSGTQGSMGRYAHRPCCLWFVLLHVRLTKPPQIAVTGEVGVRCACGRRAGRCRLRPAAIGAGFVRLVAGCGSVRPAGARGCTSRKRARRRVRPQPARAEPGLQRIRLHIF